MLAQSWNGHSNEFQTSTCIYLLACGASQSQFDVLNHAGFTLSYMLAISKLKQLGVKKLQKIVRIAHSKAFMIIWDNLNIAFRVGEQRQASKDHFNNGTTATLIPLYGVKFGELSLDLEPKHNNQHPVLEFDSKDMLLTLEDACCLEEAQLWHIEDLLYESFPELCQQFKNNIPGPPVVNLILVHKTKQHPLPTMHIDESSLNSTIEVFDAILHGTLKMSEDDIRSHGLIFCVDDQLSISLLDKVSVINLCCN